MSTSISATAVRTVYSTSNVGTSDWVVLIPSLPYMTTALSIFDSSGQTMEIGTCSASDSANSELRQILVSPGGLAIPIKIQGGMRLSIRAVSGAATSGENDCNVAF